MGGGGAMGVIVRLAAPAMPAEPRKVANAKLAEEAGVEPTEDAGAPSNGFEARAPHRERYSSAADLAELWQLVNASMDCGGGRQQA